MFLLKKNIIDKDIIFKNEDIVDRDIKMLSLLDCFPEGLREEDLIKLMLFVKENSDIRNNPYHNYQHAVDVLKRTMVIASELGLHGWEIKILQVAALLHDYDYDPACKVNEKIAADAAAKYIKNNLMETYRWQTSHINIVKNLIMDTEYNNKRTIYEEFSKILSFADVAGYIDGYNKAMREYIHVISELPIDHLPKEEQAWRKNRTEFFNYIRSRMPDGLYDYWKTALDDIQKKLENDRDVWEEIIVPAIEYIKNNKLYKLKSLQVSLVN